MILKSNLFGPGGHEFVVAWPGEINKSDTIAAYLVTKALQAPHEKKAMLLRKGNFEVAHTPNAKVIFWKGGGKVLAIVVGDY